MIAIFFHIFTNIFGIFFFYANGRNYSFVLCNINHRLLCTYFHLKHFIQMINKNEYFTWHLVGMDFCVALFFMVFVSFYDFFWLYFCIFNIFLAFQIILWFLSHFCNFSSCYKQHNWKSFLSFMYLLLYFVLYCSLGKISFL